MLGRTTEQVIREFCITPMRRPKALFRGRCLEEDFGYGSAAGPGDGCTSEHAQRDERRRGAEEARSEGSRALGASSRLGNSIARGKERS